MWSLADYQIDIPTAQIAQRPVRPADHARLMLLPRTHGSPTDHVFYQLPQLLRPGDVLVVNCTRVIPALLKVTTATGGKASLLLTKQLDEHGRLWQALGKPGRALRVGRRLLTLQGRYLQVSHQTEKFVHIVSEQDLRQVLAEEGQVPLPPYLNRPATGADKLDYQTIFAQENGAVAAPTAALHFTTNLVAALSQKGIIWVKLILHVGAGTFLPIAREHHVDFRQHTMHSEQYMLDAVAVEQLLLAQQQKRRIIAVGTTSLRALESYAATQVVRGKTQLFIYPGYQFRLVNGLLTNFHVPGSSLLLLVAAFAGRERVLAAYRHAVIAGYRFFSYGDAMLLL